MADWMTTPALQVLAAWLEPSPKRYWRSSWTGTAAVVSSSVAATFQSPEWKTATPLKVGLVGPA